MFFKKIDTLNHLFSGSFYHPVRFDTPLQISKTSSNQHLDFRAIWSFRKSHLFFGNLTFRGFHSGHDQNQWASNRIFVKIKLYGRRPFSSSLAEEAPSTILKDTPQNPKRLAGPPQISEFRSHQSKGLPRAHPNPTLRLPNPPRENFLFGYIFEISGILTNQNVYFRNPDPKQWFWLGVLRLFNWIPSAKRSVAVTWSPETCTVYEFDHF